MTVLNPRAGQRYWRGSMTFWRVAGHYGTSSEAGDDACEAGSAEADQFCCKQAIRQCCWASLPKPCLTGAAQTMGKARQPMDYVLAAQRVLQLEAEWHNSLWMAKVDVEKVFLCLNRDAFNSWTVCTPS